MIPSINDCTSYWILDEKEPCSKYVGILFGKNIMVYDKKYIDLTQLLNDNSRIHNVVIIQYDITYVLLENNNLYKIQITNSIDSKLICKNVKNIFTHNSSIYILQNNGKILDHNMIVKCENISVVTNVPRYIHFYRCLFVCCKDNKMLKFERINENESLNQTLNNNTVIDICIVLNVVYILCENNMIVICDIYGEKIITKILNGINSISAILQNKLGIIFDNNNVVVDYIYCDDSIKYNHDTYKSISIPNSPYCAKFNAQTIPYYPKYFMDRFIILVMSAKYGCNIKLPKYLYFMIADYLK